VLLNEVLDLSLGVEWRVVPDQHDRSAHLAEKPPERAQYDIPVDTSPGQFGERANSPASWRHDQEAKRVQAFLMFDPSSRAGRSPTPRPCVAQRRDQAKATLILEYQGRPKVTTLFLCVARRDAPNR